MVECCETKSQHQNKKIAFRRLAEKLLTHYIPKRVKERNASGTEVVRVYHNVDNRVKDTLTGEQQTWDEFFHDPSKLIQIRNLANHEHEEIE